MKNFLLLVALSCLTTIYSQTNLSGTLSQDLTLITSESPYQLSDHLIVGEGITLTIEPGVTIDAAGTQQILIQGGTIDSNGTLDSPIVFNSANGASISLKQTNLALSKIKFTQLNGFHLFLATGESQSDASKNFGAITLENLSSKNNNITDNSRQDNSLKYTSLILKNSNFENSIIRSS